MKRHRTFPRFGEQFHRRHGPLGYEIKEGFMTDIRHKPQGKQLRLQFFAHHQPGG
jgi:hypothetical protein